MWGEPRKGTEAYQVKLIAEARKKEAENKGLDDLLTDVYFEKLKNLASRIESNESWGKYKYPKIDNLKETDHAGITFSIGDIRYHLKESDSHYKEYGDGRYCYLDLYMDEKKVFGLMVEESSDEYSSNYTPALVTAYANDKWVSDFLEIKRHYEEVAKASEIAFAEDPLKTRRLMEEFGIENINTNLDVDNSALSGVTNETEKGKSIWKEWWFWAVVIWFLLFLLA